MVGEKYFYALLDQFLINQYAEDEFLLLMRAASVIIIPGAADAHVESTVIRCVVVYEKFGCVLLAACCRRIHHSALRLLADVSPVYLNPLIISNIITLINLRNEFAHLLLE